MLGVLVAERQVKGRGFNVLLTHLLHNEVLNSWNHLQKTKYCIKYYKTFTASIKRKKSISQQNTKCIYLVYGISCNLYIILTSYSFIFTLTMNLKLVKFKTNTPLDFNNCMLLYGISK